MMKSFLIACLQEETYDILNLYLKKVIQDLAGVNFQTFQDKLLFQFKSPQYYEFKLEIFLQMIPHVSRQQHLDFMRCFEIILQQPPQNSIFRNNINPIRLGLIFYRVLDEVQNQYEQLVYSCEQLKKELEEQMIIIFESYYEPDELIPLIENRDYNNINVYFYLSKYELYSILCTKIMDRFLTDKWWGRLDIRNSIVEFSTCFHLYEDKYENYVKQDRYIHLQKQILSSTKLKYTHLLQMQSWKQSMYLRNTIELIIIFLFTIIFQITMIQFIQNLHNSQADAEFLFLWRNAGNSTSDPFYIQFKDNVYSNVAQNSQQHDTTLIFTVIAFMTYPFKFISQKYFFYKTKKQSPKFDVNELVDICLTVCIAMWIYLRILYSSDDPGNQFMDLEPSKYTVNQKFVFNVIWSFEIDIMQNQFYFSTASSIIKFEYLLSIIAFLIWIRLFMQFRLVKAFGALFVIILKLIEELMKFFVVWIVLIMIFVCISLLAFGQVQIFGNFQTAFIYYICSIIQNWDQNAYKGPGEATNVQYTGLTFQICFMLINFITFFNLVIAIFSATYEKYLQKQNGVYYNELIEILPVNEWVDNYGCLVCGQLPFPFMLPIVILYLEYNERKGQAFLKQANQFVCKMFYLPISIVITVIFFGANVIFLPIVLFSHIQKLYTIASNQQSIIRKIKKFYEAFIFFVKGSIYLLLSLFIDTYYLYTNLYTENVKEEHGLKNIHQLFTYQDIKFFEQCIDQILKELNKEQNKLKKKGIKSNKYVNPQGNYHINLNQFVVSLQEKFELNKEILNLLFLNDKEDKFLYDERLGKTIINPKYLNQIKKFTLVKNLVADSADSSQMVDVNLMKTFVKQVYLKINIFNEKKNTGELNTNLTEEQYLIQICYELLVSRPGTIQNQLFNNKFHMNDQDFKLDQISTKINHLKNKFDTISQSLLGAIQQKNSQENISQNQHQKD